MRLRSLHKRFGTTVALDGVDLSVADGERLVVLGPSGCGKTTLLRIVAGLETPDSGNVEIGGRDVTRLPPPRRGVAMVMQSGALYPHLRVRANIEFPLRAMAMERAEIDRRVGAVTSTLGIGELLDRRPGTLSGGERQRVAVARALAHPAETLLLDEPFASLDAPLRLRLRHDLLTALRHDGRRTILVTHDQEEAIALGHRIAVMVGGRILQVGTAEELLAAPSDRRVAAFLGSPPMTFVDVTLRRGDAGWHAESRTGEWRLTLPGACVPDSATTSPNLEATLGVRGGLTWVERTDTVPATDAREAVRVSGRLDRIEPLGGHVDLHLRLGDAAALVVRRSPGAPAARLPLGSDVEFDVPSAELHLFDHDGKRLVGHATRKGMSSR